LKPLCVDLYCGLGGWAEGFLSEGYDVIGFDIEKHDYGTGAYPGQLVLQDVLSLHGSQLKRARVIVASPPCQEPSYRAMPWKRAKALNEIGPPHKFIELFNACFRIQQEASEAAGRHIPLIVENVMGAQRWVGSAAWHFGSYYLWGDLPALMPIPSKLRKSSHVPLVETPPGTGKTSWFFGNSKHEGQNWSKFAKTGEVLPHWRMEAHRDDVAGVKQRNGGTQGWFGEYKPTGQGSRNFSSNSKARKAASAQIAKIPFPLARHIAQCFKVNQ